jgi:serine/threonine-protein kinase
MGTVYRARDRVLDVEVALKVLRADLPQAPAMQERFRSEIRLARTVSHPNVCRIHDYGEEGALRYISMELVEGENLKERIRRAGPLPAEEAVRIAADVARGLEAIHEAGIVHRDVTPLNVTVDARGRVRVMDFGIAKSLAASEPESTPGYFLGNPLYVSPEQARGRKVDARSDVYALGLVLFEMLAGRPAFAAETSVATLYHHLQTDPPLDDPAVPPRLRPVLGRALAKDPESRFATARAMADALLAARESTAPLPAQGASTARRAVLLLAAAAAGAWLLWPGAPRPPQAPPATLAPAAPSPAPPTTSAPTPPPTAAPVTERGVRADASPSPAPTPEPSPTPPPPSAATQPSQAPEPPAAAVAPATGFLQVGVTPWADVAIDGVLVGQTPMPRIPLSAGVHDVLLSHPDFQPYPRRVTIRAGETLRLVVDLTSDAVRRR